MKKVLIVTYVNLFPVDAGNRRRIFNMVNMLKNNKFDVYCVHFNMNINNYYKRKMIDFFGKNHCWFYEKRDYNLINNVHRMQRQRNANKSIYWDVDELVPMGLGNFVKKIHFKEHFDIVIAEYVMTSKVLQVFGKNVLKIIDTHDILTDRNKIFTSQKQKPTGIYLKKDKEVKGLKRADVVIAIQIEEAKIFKKWLGDTPVVVVGNKIDIIDPHVARTRNILFVGSGNALNKMAGDYCINKILPKLKSFNIDYNMQFVGKVCDLIHNSSEYQKLGFVENIEELYRSARLVINPVQGGTGLNIKSIEAIGYAKPLVTTSVGAKGLPSEIMKVAASEKDFSHAIKELLDSDEKVLDMSKRANQFAIKYNQNCESNLLKALSGKNTGFSVTIVTVCKNAEKAIEKTIKSVIKQDYAQLEYLIIDGVSTDNTLRIIKKYCNDARVRCISEKDSGIYNAMNKGAKLAKGDYILFLNCGDEFLGENTISHMVDVIQKKKADVVCGDWIKEYFNKRQYVYYHKNTKIGMLLKAVCFYHMANHQSILAKRDILLEMPFDESYKVSADFLWYLQILKKYIFMDIKLHVLEEFIVDYKMDGVSAQKKNYQLMCKECERAIRQEFGKLDILREIALKCCSQEKIWEYMHIETEQIRK